jgi:hypothetical protein
MSLISEKCNVPIQHSLHIKAVCDEIKHIKQQRLLYKKSMTKEQRHESNAYRRRFENEYINPTLDFERLKSFANDCYEPVNLRDNGIIQLEWRRDNLSPAEIPISYE